MLSNTLPRLASRSNPSPAIASRSYYAPQHQSSATAASIRREICRGSLALWPRYHRYVHVRESGKGSRDDVDRHHRHFLRYHFMVLGLAVHPVGYTRISPEDLKLVDGLYPTDLRPRGLLYGIRRYHLMRVLRWLYPVGYPRILWVTTQHSSF